MELRNRIITTTQPAIGMIDGIQVFGQNNPNIVEDCIVDFTSVPNNEMDENFSSINGAVAAVKGSLFIGGIKLALNGNGDYPTNDHKGVVDYENCIFMRFGRRGPEAQDGVTVNMKNCIVFDWGNPEKFDVRNFASWAHKKASINAHSVLYIQPYGIFRGGLIRLFKDIFNHVGQAVNDDGIRALFCLKNYIPGTMRGLIATDTGKVKATNCYKNKRWIRIENSHDEMTYEEAISMMHHIVDNLTVCSESDKNALKELFLKYI